MLKKLAMLCVSAVSVFALHTAEININNKDLEVGAQFDMGQFNDNVEPNTFFLGARFLNGHDDHSDLNTTGTSTLKPLFEANLLLMKDVGNNGFRLGMGVKANYTQMNNLDFSAIPLGIEGAYTINSKEYVPMHINASVYYAPQVLTLSDADSYVEARVSFDIEVIENGNFTIGLRNIETNYTSGDFIYNRSTYLGFKLKF